MLSNDHPSNLRFQDNNNYGNKRDPRPKQNKKASTEETIRLEKVQIERKSFVLALKENARGRFLRITEDVGGRRDTIIVPSTGLDEFLDIVELMVEAHHEYDELKAAEANTQDPADQPGD